ncbi:MAG: SAM hydrolase/SAM-dependent halogenase family protein [Thermodesulfobacteriota bacterium]
MSIITLTTDFGLSDEYVGVMKGTILSRCPVATIVDLTHGIKPQDIRGAAYAIEASCPYFPEGTIHVIVVDPGVGSSRRIIALKSRAQTFLAPDNGVLSLTLPGAEQIFTVTSEELFLPQVSNTFQGRDIFAPAAAFLACGLPPDQLGPRLRKSQVKRLALPEIISSATGLKGSVVYIDHFGNLMTNLDQQTIISFCRNNFGLVKIKISNRIIAGISRSYTTGGTSGPVSLFNSRGYLEIAVPMGNAARDLGISLDEPVYLEMQNKDF